MELNNVEIIKIGNLQTFANDFRKVEFVVKDTSSQYPQEIQFNVIKDKADDFLKYNKVGDIVNIKFNLNGRSWLKEGEPESNRKWFNSLDAWSVFKVKEENSNKDKIQAAIEMIDTNFEPENKDDLPF